MEHIIFLVKLAVLDPWRSRGAAFCLLVSALFSIFPVKVRAFVLQHSDLRFDIISPVLISGVTIIAFIYLFFPNYLDHAEATMAALGGVLYRGETLYPVGDLYPYHGMVYGPALAETQWAVRDVGLPIILGSKLPGVLSFLASIAILLRLNTSPLARGYLLFMLPMGLILFWNRSEPFLLMLVSIALLVKERNAGARLSPLALGIIGGVASAFKIHAVIYVFAVYLLTFFTCGFWIFSFVLFGLGAISAFCLAYAVPGVSILAFFDYVRIIGSQGLSLRVLAGNAFYLGLMIIPVWVLYREKRLKSLTRKQLFVLGSVAGLEVFAAIIAGKPGAGVHHLLPFVAINACIIEMLLESREEKGASFVKFMYASALVPVLVSMLTVVSPMVKGWRIYGEARNELVELGGTYTDLAAAASDMDDYPYVFLRVLLSGPQLDYTAFMDLQYSGVDDRSFAMKLQKCEIMNIAVPKTGPPFSITNIYTGKPLMSDDVRMIFKEKYELIKQGVYYNVYSCNR